MSQSIDIAIIGATGAVGEVVLELLQDSDIPVGKLFLLASERTAGTSAMFNKKPHRVEELASFDFNKVKLALFVANDEVAKEKIPEALAAGCLVLDNSRTFVDDDNVPVIIPSVNGSLLTKAHKHIANPDSAVVLLWSVLKPIMDSVGIESINVTTFQAVSGQGRKAISELASQTASLLNMKAAKAEVYDKQIAFNLLPAVGPVDDEGICLSERHLTRQSAKLMAGQGPVVNATTVQVPVFYGDCLSVNIHTEESVDASDIIDLLKKSKVAKVMSGTDKKALVTPVSDAAGKDKIFVSRIRNDLSHGRGINLWIAGDNVRAGAAVNTIGIVELLLKDVL